MIKLVYLAVIGAIYLYNAYQSSQKKRAAELKKQQQSQPQPNIAPVPAKTYETRKPATDTFREMFGEQTPLRPKPVVKPLQPKKPVAKPAPKAVTATASSSIQPRAEQPAEVNIHDASLEQANNAYAFSTDLESYVFNPREAVIASIILNRPEY